MNYYEELGVAQDASVESIRHAYKTLARLLHPDGQTDEKVRAMADRQMQRLNEVLETLADTEKRQEYDAELERNARRAGHLAAARLAGHPLLLRREPAPLPPGGQRDWVQAAVRHWFPVLIGMPLLITAVAWYSLPREAAAVDPVPLHAVQSPPEMASQSRVSPIRHRKTEAAAASLASRDSSKRYGVFRPVEAGEPETEPLVAPPLAGEQAETASPAIPTPAAENGSAQAQVEESPFAGKWLFRPQPGLRTGKGGYSAVHAEFLLEERRGGFVGTFRARYLVPDQALPPELLLHVSGESAAGSSSRMDWTSRDGAKGILELNLRSPGLLDVTWWTTRFANRPALTSGQAELIRQVP